MIINDYVTEEMFTVQERRRYLTTSPNPELRDAQITPVYVTRLEWEKETMRKLAPARIVTTET